MLGFDELYSRLSHPIVPPAVTTTRSTSGSGFDTSELIMASNDLEWLLLRVRCRLSS